MSKLSAKVNKPVCIKVTTDNAVLSHEDSIQKYNLDNRIKISGEHYGFTLIKCIDEIEYKETYPTQERLSAVEVNDGILSVYEYGKYNPWKFDNDGIMLENPTFNSIYDIEIEDPINNDEELINIYVKK